MAPQNNSQDHKSSLSNREKKSKIAARYKKGYGTKQAG